MKKTLKCLSVIIVMLTILFSFSITALAQTTTQDGLQVNLTTDKQSYSLNEDIKITVSVTNTNDFTVKDVSIEALLPDKFELKDSNDETSTKAIDLKSGEQANLTVVAVVKGEEQNVTNPTESTVEPNTEPNNTTEPTTKPIESNTGNTQNTKPNTQTTTSIISNNDNNKSDKSDDNTKNNNNQDNTSIKTGSDYTYMGIFIVLLLASISTLLYCLIKHFNKTTKIISSILCVVIAVTSVVGISKFNAFAQENNSSTITVSEKIKVDNKDYTITAKIGYGLSLSGGTIVDREDIIKDFTLKATPFDILVGEKTDVIFKAEYNKSNVNNLKPALYDEDNNFITYLFDNGENGDEIANDGIYSVKLNLYSAEEKFVNYYVFVNERLASNAEEIFFYTNFTNEDLNEIVTFETELSKIENKYVQSNGYTKEKDVNTYLQEVCNLCETLNQQVKSYDYDMDNNSVFIELNSGMTYLITPQIEGRLVGGSSNEIITVAPSQTSINTAIGNLLLGDNYSSVADTANEINKKITDYFSYNNKFEDNEVTIDNMKNLSPYKLLIWNGHGAYNKKKDIVALGTATTILKLTLDEFNPYIADIKSGRIAKSKSYLSPSSTLFITSKFVDDYFPQSDDAIVYLGCCYSLANDSFGESFISKGVGAVYGYDKSIDVKSEVEIRNKLFNDLCEFNEETNNYNTVIDAYNKRFNGFFELGFTYYIADSSICLIGNRITGQVIDANNNEPISNVKISCDEININCTTDIDGKFSFDIDSHSKQHTFTFEHENYKLTKITISPNGYSSLKSVKLQRKTGSVSGGVVKDSKTNNPIKDVRVEVIDNSSDSLEPIATTTTDENGNFNLKLPYGSYSLSFNHDNYNYYGMSLDVDSEYIVLQNPVLLNSTTSENLIQNNDIVTLTGVLKTEDYEINSNNKGTVTILDLDNPIKCYLKDGNNYDGKTEYNIKSVQISSPDLKEYIGQNVTVKGKVMLAHTAHHRRDVVLLESEVIKLNSIENYKEDFINALLENEDEWYVNWGASVGYQSELTFTDLNFDGKPEFIMQYGGGSMRNNNASAYYFSNNKLFEANTWFQNNLTAYYDKSNNSYVMLGNAYAKGGVNYWWYGDFELSFDGINIISDYYSSYIAEDLNYTGNFIYTYYNGANGYGDVNGLSKITETEYNKINEEKLKNLVNINMKREFILCSDWEKYSASEKRQALEKAYDSFTYDKY